MTCTVDGPLTSGMRGRPYASSIVDLVPYGYSEKDYLVSGEATPYLPRDGSPLPSDGHWDVVRGESLPFRTRILVRLPPPERFNGTVVIEFLQEYFGNEKDTNFRWNAEALLREGFAWVGASLHHEGIDGPSGVLTDIAPGFQIPNGPTLAAWDEERYGGLSFPTTDLCYDVLTQVARAVGARRTRAAVDPMEGLPVEHVLACGNTIAASRLEHYINAVQPMEQAIDGFFLQDLVDAGITLSKGVNPPADTQLRTDTAVPVIVLNTVTAAVTATRQEEGDYLRFWEPAGSSHTTGPYMERVAAATKRDVDADTPLCPPGYANTMPVQYVSGAAFVALHNWVGGGAAAPRFPVLERELRDGEPSELFDEQGNTLGGLRTPWVDVPVARYDWRGECLGGAGRTYPFDAEQLTSLYGDVSTYLKKFEAAVQEALDLGVILPDDARQAIDDAKKVSW